MDGAGAVTEWNGAVAALTGVAASEAKGRPATELLLPKSHAVLQTLLVQAAQGVMSVVSDFPSL